MLKSKSRSFADAKLTLQKYACERKMLLVSNDLLFFISGFCLVQQHCLCHRNLLPLLGLEKQPRRNQCTPTSNSVKKY